MKDDYILYNGYIGLSGITLRKSTTEKNVIFIEASNETPDCQDEMVLQKALIDEAESFMRKGVISWNHLHKVEKNPKYICGEPLDVAFPVKGKQRGTTLVKAKIYPSNDYGKTILKMAEDGSTRLGASVGGGILQKANMYVDSMKKSIKAIVKVIWDEVAITHEPVNEGTLGRVSFMPFESFAKSFILDDRHRAEELQKALSAGYGTDSSQFSGGRALVPEHLMGVNGKRKDRKLVDAFKLALIQIKKGKVRDFSDLVRSLSRQGMKSYSFIVAKTIAERFDELKKVIAQ